MLHRQIRRTMATGLKRDTKENIRLSKIAQYLTELKELRRLCKENREHLNFLKEFKEEPISLLQGLAVDWEISEKVFVLDGVLSPDFIESFRKTASRRFWE